MSEKQIKSKKVEGRISVVKAMPYHGCMVYIRYIKIPKTYLFEYLAIIKGELYSSSIEIQMSRGQKKLNNAQINEATAATLSAAYTTVEAILGIEPDKKNKSLAEDILRNIESAGAN